MPATDFRNWHLYQFEITYRKKSRRAYVFTPVPADAAALAAGKAEDETMIRHKISAVDEAFQKSFIRKKPRLPELQKFFLALARAYAVSADFRNALTLAVDMAETPYFRGVIAGLIYYKSQSDTLANLFGRFPESFNPTIIAMIKQAEATGNYAEIFRQFAEELNDNITLLREIRQGLTYPAVVALVGICGTIVTNFFILPKMSENFRAIGFPLPPITRALMSFNAFLLHNTWVMALPIAALVLAWIKRTAILRHPTIQSGLICLPIFGELYRKVILARSLRTLAMLLKNGIWQKVAYAITSEVSDHPEFKAFFLAISERISAGTSPHAAYLLERHRLGAQGRDLANEMRVAAITGEPSEILETVSRVYKELAMDAARAFPKLIEPVLILLLTCLVGFLVAAIYLPNFYAVSFALKQANSHLPH
jgi:type IV pilus assembly protein PilC